MTDFLVIYVYYILSTLISFGFTKPYSAKSQCNLKLFFEKLVERFYTLQSVRAPSPWLRCLPRNLRILTTR